MSTTNKLPTMGPDDPLWPRLQIDRLCRDFERQRQARPGLTIEQFLNEAGGRDLDGLLAELTAIDRELSGDTPLTEVTAADLAPISANHPAEAPAVAEPSSDVPTLVADTEPDRPLHQPSLAGRTLGGYRLIRELGRGGMGVVYEAEQSTLRRRIALKVVPDGPWLPPEMLQRFTREAQVLARLDHPNIVPIYEAGTAEGTAFLAMKLIDGISLDRTIRKGNASPNSCPEWASLADLSIPERERRVAEIGLQAARALEAAHAENVIHRDVKPSNLLLQADGQVILTDFGLAKDLSQSDGLTRVTDFVGTLRYSPPESFEGVVDARSDVFSLGLTLYELMTLKPAFEKPPVRDVIGRVTQRRLLPLQRVLPTVSPEFSAIIARATAPRAADRFPTMSDFVAALHDHLTQAPHRTRVPSHRQQTLTAVGFVFGASVVGLALWLSLSDNSSRDRAVHRGADATDATVRATATPSTAMSTLTSTSAVTATVPQPRLPTAPTTAPVVDGLLTPVQTIPNAAGGFPLRSIALLFRHLIVADDGGHVRAWELDAEGQPHTFLNGLGRVRQLVTDRRGTTLVAVSDAPVSEVEEDPQLPRFRVDVISPSGWRVRRLRDRGVLPVNDQNEPIVPPIVRDTSPMVPVVDNGELTIYAPFAPTVHYLAALEAGQKIAVAAMQTHGIGVAYILTDGRVWLARLDASLETQVIFPQPPTGPPNALAFADQSQILVVSNRAQVFLTDIRSEQRRAIAVPPGLVIDNWRVAWKGPLAAAVGTHGYALLDTPSGAWLGEPITVPAPLRLVTFLDDEDAVLAITTEGTLHLTEIASRQQIWSGRIAEADVPCLEWLSRTQQIATADAHGTVRIYKLPPHSTKKPSHSEEP